MARLSFSPRFLRRHRRVEKFDLIYPLYIDFSCDQLHFLDEKLSANRLQKGCFCYLSMKYV